MQQNRAILAAVPFAPPLTFDVRAGQSVNQVLVEVLEREWLAPDDLASLEVWVDGARVPRETALDVVLKDTTQLALIMAPEGGGDGDKDLGQILFNLAVLVVSFYVGGPMGPLANAAAWVRTAAAAAVQIAGAYAGQALFAPPKPAKAAGERYALGGQSNGVRIDQPMPLVLGKQTVPLDIAAQPYTQTIGEDVYLHIALGAHYGPCEVSNIRIANTPIASYGADVEVDVQTSVGVKSSTLYPGRVAQLDLGDELELDGGPENATSAVNAERLEIDLVFPSGLVFIKDGKNRTQSVTITAGYRVAGSSDAFTPWLSETITRNAREPVRITRTLNLPTKGQYEVQVSRNATEAADDRRQTVVWTALRTFENLPAVQDPNLSLIFLKVRSTKELNGTLPPVTATVEPIAEVWNGTSWGDPQATSNPAALVRMLVTGPNAAQPLDASEIGATFGAFYDRCEARGYAAAINWIADSGLDAAMQATAACGGGAVWHDGAKLQLAWEGVKPVPRALFNGRNARDFRLERSFGPAVHGLRVTFRDSTKSGEGAEIIVYADGFGPSTADLIEGLELDREMSPQTAWTEGRKALVRRVNSGRVWSWTTDAGGLDTTAVRFGARVLIAPPLLETALASVQIENVHMAGGMVVGVRLDDEVELAPATTFGLRVGTPARGILTLSVQATGGAGGLHRDLYFESPLAVSAAPEAGDVAVFGIVGNETHDVEIATLQPQADQSVRITATPYLGVEIEAAEAETPPSGILGAPGSNLDPPAAPRIFGHVIDADGSITVSFDIGPTRGAAIESIAVRVRYQYAPEGLDAPVWGAWSPISALPATATAFRVPPPFAAGGMSGLEQTGLAQIEMVSIGASLRSAARTRTMSFVQTPIIAGDTRTVGGTPSGTLLTTISVASSTATAAASTAALASTLAAANSAATSVLAAATSVNTSIAAATSAQASTASAQALSAASTALAASATGSVNTSNLAVLSSATSTSFGAASAATSSLLVNLSDVSSATVLLSSSITAQFSATGSTIAANAATASLANATNAGAILSVGTSLSTRITETMTGFADRWDQGGDGFKFYEGFGGRPESVTPIIANGSTRVFSTVAGIGRVLTVTDQIYAQPREIIAFQPNKTYRVKFLARRVTTGTGFVSAYINPVDGSFNHSASLGGYSLYLSPSPRDLTVGEGWVEFTLTITTPNATSDGIIGIRPRLDINGGGGQIQFTAPYPVDADALVLAGAAIAQASTVAVTATAATAALSTSISSSLSSANATIAAVSSTAATASSAQATINTNLSTSLSTNAATITGVSTATATNTTAIATLSSSLSAVSSTNTAAATSLTTVITNNSSAVATAISTLTASTSTVTAGLSVTAAVVAGVSTTAVRYEVLAAATGSRPASLGLLLADGTSGAWLRADRISFGDNTVFVDANDTLRTLYSVSGTLYVRVIAFGPTFGANFVEWQGPASVVGITTIDGLAAADLSGWGVSGSTYVRSATGGVLLSGTNVVPGAGNTGAANKASTSNGTSGAGWQTIVSATVTGPVGLAVITGFVRVLSATGDMSVEARLLIDGSEVATLPAQTVWAGGSLEAHDFSDLFGGSYSVSAGQRTYALQLRRVTGSADITATSNELTITVTALVA